MFTIHLLDLETLINYMKLAYFYLTYRDFSSFSLQIYLFALFSNINYINRIMSENFENKASITIEEIYNTANRNYEWQSFKYVVPKKYNQGPVKQLAPSKSQPKLNYIDDVLRIKKCIPAPNAYTITTLDRPLSGKMDKNPRMTLTDAILSKKKRKQSPGPGAYFTRPQTANPNINKHVPEYREHYLHEVQYLSSQYPGVGQYNLTNVKGHVSSMKYFKPVYIKQKQKADQKNQKKEKQNANKEPQVSLVTGTFEWISKQKRLTNKNFFGKSKRFVMGSKFDKKPGPNFYNLNTKWTDNTNILKTSSSFCNVKSVYYH